MKHARKASVVHLASEALPKMPTDVTAYIQSIENTAEAATQLVQDYESLTTYVYSVDWVMIALFGDDADKCLTADLDTTCQCNPLLACLPFYMP